jgi:hypothetical protein
MWGVGTSAIGALYKKLRMLCDARHEMRANRRDLFDFADYVLKELEDIANS